MSDSHLLQHYFARPSRYAYLGHPRIGQFCCMIYYTSRMEKGLLSTDGTLGGSNALTSVGDEVIPNLHLLLGVVNRTIPLAIDCSLWFSLPQSTYALVVSYCICWVSSSAYSFGCA